MRNMLNATFILQASFGAIVKSDQEKVALETIDGVEVEVDPKSFSYGRPRLLCLDEGRVYSKNRLCGE